MRSLIFMVLGILELAVGVVLAYFGCHLPEAEEIHRSFDTAARATQQTSRQVRLLHQQIHDLRRPELREMAKQLQAQTQIVTTALKGQKVDFDQVQTVTRALGDVATGLDNFVETLNPQSVGKLGDGLNSVADYLDQKVAPAATQAADRLDASTKALQADARHLSELLRHTPPDLRAAREIHDGLQRFNAGLDTIQSLLQVKRLETMREGFRGLQTSLTTGAEQVERLSSYSYPNVTLQGFRPHLERRRFWPEGERIAHGMLQAAAGVQAAGQELDALAADLPTLRVSVEESRKLAEKTRQALALALQQQGKMESLLKDVPNHVARFAEELPNLSKSLSRILRDTSRLKEVAGLLRQTQQSIDTAVARWPELRVLLARSAVLLRTTQQQMGYVLEHRSEYEAALHQSIVLADTFSAMLPLFVEQLDWQLQEQEQSLEDLGQSINEASAELPVYERTTVQLVQTGRLLLWLVTVIVGLHGVYLVLSVRLGALYST